MNQENLTIKEVTRDSSHYHISCKEGVGFSIETMHGVVPKAGNKITIYTSRTNTIRGVAINGDLVYYKSDGQLAQERKQWIINNEKEKKEKFEKNKHKLDKQYASLPNVFKNRINRFRKNNPRFRVDYEAYELFTCTQAVIIAQTLKTPEKVQDFQKKQWDEQKKLVKKLDNGHSGNTFGMACSLAYWYLKQPGIVTKAHGALSSLVGSKEYGDVKKKNPKSK